MEGSSPAKGKASGDKPPVIVDHLTSQVVKDGDKVSLTCRIKGEECLCQSRLLAKT